jgi:hypothetical protein
LHNQYGTAGAIAAINENGTIKNIVCYVENYSDANNYLQTLNYTIDSENPESVYIGEPKADAISFTENSDGATWFNVPDYGTVYGNTNNNNFKLVVTSSLTWTMGQTAKIIVYETEHTSDQLSFYCWAGYNAAEFTGYNVSLVGSAEVADKQNCYEYTLQILNGNYLSDGSTFSLGVYYNNSYIKIISVTMQKVITGITVTAPTKTDYTVGDELDLTGGKVTVNYSDGSSDEPIDITAGMVSGFDSSAAGEKTITVTYQGKQDSFTVNVAGVYVQSISLGTENVKNGYQYNEELDFSNLTLTANYSDGGSSDALSVQELLADESATVNIQTATVEADQFENDVATLTITITYQGKTASFDVTVNDFATALSVTQKDDSKITYSKATVLTEDMVKDGCDFVLTMASSNTKNLSASDVTLATDIGEIVTGEQSLSFTYGSGESALSETAKIGIWYGVADSSDFDVIRNNLNGYYILLNDISFEKSGKVTTIKSIGTAPINATVNVSGTEAAVTMLIDPSGVGNQLTIVGGETDNTYEDRRQAGVAFNGIFDGDGKTISWFKIYGGEQNWKAAAYGASLFGYIGSEGVVRNFTMDNAVIWGGAYNAFIAGLNLGTIDNITIKSSCTMYSGYSSGVIAAAYNNGHITNVTCYTMHYKNNKDAILDLTIVYTGWSGDAPTGKFDLCYAFDGSTLSLDGTTDTITVYYFGTITYDPYPTVEGISDSNTELRLDHISAITGGHTYKYYLLVAEGETSSLQVGDTITATFHINDYNTNIATLVITVTNPDSNAEEDS